MNYIYDIYINLNKELYDFFEWNKSDNILRIKKMPIFIINTTDLLNIISSEIIIDKNILKNIYNSTELWNKSKMNYCAAFCDKENIIVIEFNKNGYSIKKSYLSIDDELDVIDDFSKKSPININFNIVSKRRYCFKTRKEIKMSEFINNELSKIDNKRLDYLCFECIGKKEKNKENAISILKKLIDNKAKYKKLYDILKLTSKPSNKMI